MRSKLSQITCFILCFACVSALSAAQENLPQQFGAGLILGAPTGLTAKYFLNKDHSFDAALGFGDVSLHADYLWHSWSFFPQPASGSLATYLGLGLKAADKKNDIVFGVRAPIGASFSFPRHPVEVFLEVVPVLELIPGTGLGIDAGFGVRYYFK